MNRPSGPAEDEHGCDRRPQSADFVEATDAADQDIAANPGPTGFEQYEYTAMEAGMMPVPFDDRIDLETHAYALVLGFMSFGGIGWVGLFVGAGLNFLFS